MFRGLKDKLCKSQAVAVIQNLLTFQIKKGELKKNTQVRKIARQIVEDGWESNSFILSGGLGERPHKQLVAAFCLACKVADSQDNPTEEKRYMMMFCDIINEFNINARLHSFSSVDYEVIEASREITAPLMRKYKDLHIVQVAGSFLSQVYT